MPPRLCATNKIGSWCRQPSHPTRVAQYGPTSFSISRSSFTARSRPCCDTLFLLFASNKPPIASALYPYVHTLASGISSARYSSGQNNVRDTEPSALSLVEVDFLKIDMMVFSLLGVTVCGSSRPSSHVYCGCPRKPCTKMMLCPVSQGCLRQSQCNT